MRVSFLSFLWLLVFWPFSAGAKLNVITSTMNLYSLAQYIGGDKITVESLTQGPQDPHFHSAKPSYMLKAKKADLLLFAGLDLEVGWLGNIIQGSRNPRIQKGQPGHLPAGQFIQALNIPKGKVDRFFGDVHPFGNPHFLLDPLRALKVSQGISEKLSALDSENKNYYSQNQKKFKSAIHQKMKEWRGRVKRAGIKNVVTYHSSFEYFLDRFHIDLIGQMEEKPGIPPSAKHILKLVKKMKEKNNSCILMSSFYSNQWIKKIKKLIPVNVEKIAIETKALPSATNYILMIDGLVQSIENCGDFAKNLAKSSGKNTAKSSDKNTAKSSTENKKN